MTKNNHILILGLGSGILTDDGLPLKIIADLQNDQHMDSLHFRTANTGGLDMLDHLSGFSTVIIIDTITTKGTPGKVRCFTPGDDKFVETFHLSSYHDTTFSLTLALGKKLGLHIPDQIWIMAIEIIEGLEFSTQNSTMIESVYPGILSEVKEGILRVIRPFNLHPVKKIKEPKL